jgi:predicted  nucleic acid-binding Zn-ribbon protein
MIQVLQQLEQSIETYQKVQAKHLNALDTEAMPDLSRQNFERSLAFSDMKNNLDLFLNRLNPAEPGLKEFAAIYRDRLAQVMDHDQALKNKIIEHRDRLKQTMAKVNREKTAVQGYSKSVRPESSRSVRISG